MKNKFVIFCILVVSTLAASTFLQAKILEIYSIKDLQAHLTDENLEDESSLVVFDIDNTLMEPVQTIGSDQWFDNRIKKLLGLGYSLQEVFGGVFDEWHKIQTICDVKLVEQETKQVFDAVKERYNVIALTTRGFYTAYNTFTQLKDLGIIFENKPYISEEVFFQNGNDSLVMPGVLFIKGILFTNNTHKGEALFKLLDRFQKKPKAIVFINDKRAHLAQVEETAQKRGVTFIGLRYGFTDEKVKNFDFNLTNLSKINFANFIKDKEKEASSVK